HGDTRATLDAAPGVDDRRLELPEPGLARRLLDAAHLLADAEAGHQADPLSVARRSALARRRDHRWKGSSGPRSVRYRRNTRTRASGTSSTGLAPSTQSMNPASAPRLPPMPMS